MFDIGWQELMLIGVVALVVIGPKDMPVAMRAAARMFSKVRGLTREFQNTVSEVVREAELDELRRKVQAAGRVNIKDELTNLVDPTGRMRDDLRADEFEDLDDDVAHKGPTPGRPPGATAPGTAPPNASTAQRPAAPHQPATSGSTSPPAASAGSPAAEGDRRA